MDRIREDAGGRTPTARPPLTVDGINRNLAQMMIYHDGSLRVFNSLTPEKVRRAISLTYFSFINQSHTTIDLPLPFFFSYLERENKARKKSIMSGRYGSDESGTPSRGGGYGRSGGSGSGGYGGNSQSRGGGYQSGGGGGAYQSGDRGNRGGGGGRGGGRGGGSGREGDWVCPSPSCGNVNFARRTECNKCGTPSPGGSGNGGYNRGGGGGDGAYNRGSGGGNRGGRSDYGGRGDYDRRGTNEGYSQVPPPASGNNYPPPPSYGGMSSYGADPVTSQNGSNSYPPSYGAPPNPYGAGQGGGGGPPSNYNSDHQGGGYGAPAEAVPVKVKQCDENCGDTCDNSRIYISNLPSDVTIEELQELFGGIGMVGRIKQKRGYKDQWPWNIKIYTDDNGKKKGMLV